MSKGLQMSQSHLSSMQQHVSQQIDHGMQHMGVSAVNLSRDMIKMEHKPDDWMITRAKKSVYNYGVDKVADNFEYISKQAKDFSSELGGKIVPSTLDRFNPMHATNVFIHPELARRYMAQRWQQVTQPIEFYNDPRGFANKKMGQLKNSFWNMHERYGELDGGNKLMHGGKAFVDYAQDKAAPIIGGVVTAFGIYNMSPFRKQTKQAMDSMFPKSTMYGQAARMLPTRLMLTNKLAKIKGNPRLTLALLGYSAVTGIGKSIADSLELQKTLPNTYNRLRANSTEMYKSSSQLDMHNSIQRTSKTRRNSQ